MLPETDYTPTDMMVVTASRFLRDGEIVFIGIGLPSLATNLARRLHAPNIIMNYESGTLDTKPGKPPLSIGDDELSLKALSIVSGPEMFRYWLQGGTFETGFLAAAQIDRYANLNSTVIGNYHNPKVRLPGAGGAPEIAHFCHRTIIMLRQTRRSFVEQLDFTTTLGFGEGGDSITELGHSGKGLITVITDLGILESDPVSKELVQTYIHPGATTEQVKESTGWDLRIAGQVKTTAVPGEEELTVLKDLQKMLK
jgi:glutaconate CoA-transferase subunit B